MIFFKDIIAEEQNSKVVKRSVIYARYSSDMQDTSDSIEVQVSECKKYALNHDILIVREPFVDRAETGTSTENRKSYQELLKIAQSRERDFDVILTFHTSRWGRGIESEIDEYLLEKNGIKIIAVSQPFTADDAIESMFMKGILRKIDAYYSMQTSKYTHAYQTSNAQNGFKNGGTAPDGYMIEHEPTGKKDKHGKEKMKSRLALNNNPGKYDVTDKPRHKLIEFAFLNAYQGKGIRWLSKEIYRQGWRGRYTNEPISTSTIRTWLMNPVYTGYMVWNRAKFFRKNGKRVYRYNSISKWVFSQQPSHPALVSKEMFEAVANKFLSRAGRGRGKLAGAGHEANRSNSINSNRYTVSGLLDCGLCGAKYVAGQNKHRGKATQVYMMCNTKWRYGKKKCSNVNINLAVAEGAIIDALLNRLLTEKEIEKFIQAFNDSMDRNSEKYGEERAGLIKQKERLEREISNILKAVRDGMTSSLLARELQESETALGDVQAKLSLLESADSVPNIRYEPSKLGVWIQSLRDLIVGADFDMRRELVRHFIKNVVVQPDRTGKMRWDLPAIVNFFNGQEVPSETLDLKVLKVNGCGGWI